jgi:hypothetical protein
MVVLCCRHHVDGVMGRIRRVYCLDAACKPVPGSCIQGNPFKNGTRMLVTSYALSQVRTCLTYCTRHLPVRL